MGVNKVEVNGSTILDLTGDNVTPQTLLVGVIAHDAAGERIVGTLDLSAKQDVLLTSGAAVGNLIKVAAVDENGKPTAWAVAEAGTDYAGTTHASTSVYGIVKLSNSVTSSSKTLGATPNAVKTALAQAKAYTDSAIAVAIQSAY
uniref:Tail fiber repeat protein n=1 Tax=Myoviridae sp. ctPVE25 TaxID=2826649 RepID=A0A8S5R0L0_9CAUD|nr:MAG TPA: tail fiber repeat protein [Myoviridae sp. ctPVE25]